MILVTGTGRSGTSTTARILHERLHVPMGGDLDEPNQACPEGSYEDRAFREMHMRLERGLPLSEFADQLALLIRVRGVQVEGPWGLKDPRAADVIGLWVQWFDPLVIWCRRDLEAVARSWARVTTSSLEQARRRAEARDQSLRNLLQDRPRVLELDFDEPQDEDHLAGRLQAWLESVGVFEPGSAP